jgi:hypothetical protein
MFAVDDLGKTVGTRHGSDNDIPAVAPVAAVRSSSGNILLPPEATTAPPAITTFDVKGNPIDKHFLVRCW